ncbi:YceD family protein [Gryllotalpicola protaetiae]|uniref:DUF177 domain-containing protein n=1 Tax=Gryllotalpicola protaetiae TaxID=2419771 RepID=A0A387BME0_9MICO|nr:DUF177 domain-containing protein [Gryllotalpicola protaetiae]AYG02157.1 DUF177 domain-containing protein [Gryllotalpicola protaetiae]
MSAAKNPYSVAVFDLVHQPGQSKELALDFAAPEKLGEGMIAVQAGAPVQIDLRLEVLHDGILASGEVDTTAEGQCVRCLTDVAERVQVDFQELFAYTSDEAFDFEVHDDHVDLEPLVRDSVVLSLPFQPVCRPDCPGLDPETGERLADHPDREPRENTDPRWAALADFRASEDTEAGTTGTDTEER